MQHTEPKANKYTLALYVVQIRSNKGRPALIEANLIWKLYLEYHKPFSVWIVLWGTTN